MKRRFGKKYKHNNKSLLMIIFLIFSFIYLFNYVERNIRPTVLAMSEIKARLIASQAISKAVNEKIASHDFDDIMFVKTDNNGKVTMVQANTVKMNRLASDTTLAIQEEIQDMAARGLSIPLSNVFGSQIFASAGPKIRVDILPAGSVNVDFYTDFEEAGINQTRLKVYLIVKTNVQIIVPLASNKVDVTAHIPVAETIIVGDVPESYITVPENEITNFVPTKDPINN